MTKDINIKPTGQFLRSTLLLFLTGLVMTFALAFTKDSRELIILGVVGSIMATIIGTVFNLLYFIPTQRTEVRMLLPGLLTIATVVIIWWASKSDLYFFGIFGFINFGLGLWAYKDVYKTNAQR